MAKVIERVQARYEVQEVEFGKVYKWHPAHIVRIHHLLRGMR